MFKEQEIYKLVNIISIATDRVLSVYKSQEFGVVEKDDRTPLTLADKKSHDYITKGLKELTPEFPILSEEGKEIPYEERSKWQYFWLIDPLDGTKEFIKKNGEFTINIALVKGSRPVFGIVSVPVKEEIFFACKGLGAFKINFQGKPFTNNQELLVNAQRLPISSDRDYIAVVGSRSHRDENTEKYIESLKRFGNIQVISLGSSYKICYLAEGSADIYPRFGRTMEWDISAGQIILEESGGTIVNAENSKPLEYNKKSLENPPFIAKSKHFIEKYER